MIRILWNLRLVINRKKTFALYPLHGNHFKKKRYFPSNRAVIALNLPRWENLFCLTRSKSLRPEDEKKNSERNPVSFSYYPPSKLNLSLGFFECRNGNAFFKFKETENCFIISNKKLNFVRSFFLQIFRWGWRFIGPVCI